MTLELINEEEQKILTEMSRINRTDRIDSEKFRRKNLAKLNEDVKGDRQTAHEEVYPNVYYVPLMWAVNIVNVAKAEQRITEPANYAKLLEVGYLSTRLVLLTHMDNCRNSYY